MGERMGGVEGVGGVQGTAAVTTAVSLCPAGCQ